MNQKVRKAILILFLCCVFITGGIDKEHYIIPNGLIIYGLIISVANLVVEKFCIGNSIYTNIIGAIAIPLILLMINVFSKRRLKVDEVPFGEGDIKYLSILGLFCGFGLQVMILEVSLILILIYKLIKNFI